MIEKYKTFIGVCEEDINRVKKVCDDIKIKDSNFGYKIKEPTGELKQKFKWILIVFSDTQEMADKRGGWFIHVCRDIKVADYFWTRKCRRSL